MQDQPSRWERFAQEDPEFHILSARRDYSTAETQAFFFETGEAVAAEILELVSPWLASRELVVEIGCGSGRLLLPMARTFGRAVGIDISPTMLRLLRENCERFGVGNVQGHHADDEWHRGLQADLIFSRIVFRHVEDLEVIDDYVRRSAAALGPSGVCYLHFDTRPATLPYRLRNALPDRVLPRSQRRGMRGIRRRAADLAASFERHGLEVLDERGSGTKDHVYVVGRGASPRAER